MYLLLDVSALEPIRYKVWIQTNQIEEEEEKKSPTITSTEITKGYQGASSTRFWPTWTHPHFPPQWTLVPAFLLIKTPQSGCLNKDGLRSPATVGRGMIGKAVRKTQNLAGTSYLPHISKDEKWYLPCCISLLLSHHQPAFPSNNTIQMQSRCLSHRASIFH